MMFRVRRPNKNISPADARKALGATTLDGLKFAKTGAAAFKNDTPVDARIGGKVRALVVYVPREWEDKAHLEIHSTGAPLEFAEHVAFALAATLDAQVYTVKQNIESKPLAKPRSRADALAKLPDRAPRTGKAVVFSDERFGDDLVCQVMQVMQTVAPKLLGKPTKRTLTRRTFMGSGSRNFHVESALDERGKATRSFVSLQSKWSSADRELVDALNKRFATTFVLTDPVKAAGTSLEDDQ